MSLWTGLLAPRGTPREVVERLNTTLAGVLASAEVKERLIGLGATPMGDTTERFAAFIQRERVSTGASARARS
jgi:tripartite-type tricarboxylate transporter receptor subunit TctC